MSASTCLGCLSPVRNITRLLQFSFLQMNEILVEAVTKRDLKATW